MNLSEEDILSVFSFHFFITIFSRLICLIVYFWFLFCFSLFLFDCLVVILPKKRENGRAMGCRRHSENRALYFDIFKFS